MLYYEKQLIEQKQMGKTNEDLSKIINELLYIEYRLNKYGSQLPSSDWKKIITDEQQQPQESSSSSSSSSSSYKPQLPSIRPVVNFQSVKPTTTTASSILIDPNEQLKKIMR